jgi:hypothetical protein
MIERIKNKIGTNTVEYCINMTPIVFIDLLPAEFNKLADQVAKISNNQAYLAADNQLGATVTCTHCDGYADEITLESAQVDTAEDIIEAIEHYSDCPVLKEE